MNKKERYKIIQKYKDAYFTVHGVVPEIIHKGGGWYCINGKDTSPYNDSLYQIHELEKMKSNRNGQIVEFKIVKGVRALPAEYWIPNNCKYCNKVIGFDPPSKIKWVSDGTLHGTFGFCCMKCAKFWLEEKTK